ncbi:MAG: phosphate ABC transporter substrate-binding/OmpA family protein [Pseudomonadota bacterium]
MRAILFVMCLCCGWPAFGQTVTLSFPDGSFSVSGQLMDFDGEYYDISTSYGVLTLSSATTVCTGADCPDPADFVPVIRIAGSAALGELLVPELISDFATQNGWILNIAPVDDTRVDVDMKRPDNRVIGRFQVMLSSTSAGYTALAEHRADIIMARRSPLPAEQANIAAAYQGGSYQPYRTRVIGWENLRLYTNTDNATDVLTISQLIKMMEPGRAVWPDETAVHLRGDIDSVIAMMQQFEHETVVPPMNTGGDTDQGVVFITPNLTLPLQHITLSPTCGIANNGLAFEPDTHPLSSPLYLITPTVRQSHMLRQFLDYALSVGAQRVVSEVGYKSRTISETALTSESGFLVNAILNATPDTVVEDLQRAVQELHGFGRLSLSFRFEEGTQVLDAVSQSNLDFAAALLQQPQYENRRFIFAGFSDGTGAAAINRALSENRANFVRNAIRTRMGDQAMMIENTAVFGFGEALPLACNDTSWGQNQNRRVEIWIQ